MGPKVPPFETAFKIAKTHPDEIGVNYALVGGLAVTIRTRPRFTEVVDFAVSLNDDSGAESIIHSLLPRGFDSVASIENEVTQRMATMRLTCPNISAVIIDILFNSCGIEQEIVQSATNLKVLDEPLKVACVGHLIAMKILSRNDKSRPNDSQDLVNLIAAANSEDIKIAQEALLLIKSRGCNREKDLIDELEGFLE